MAITAMFYREIEYFRITRTWDQKKTQIQKYVRIQTAKHNAAAKKLRREAFELAKFVDDGLAQQQIANQLLRENNAAIRFHPTGKIVGVNRVFHIKTRRGRLEEVHEFSVRVRPKKGAAPRYAHVSIFFHGLREAFDIAIEKYCIHAGLLHNKPLVNLLKKSFRFYQNDPTRNDQGFTYNGRGRVDNLPVLDEPICLDLKEVKLKKASPEDFEKDFADDLANFNFSDSSVIRYPAKKSGLSGGSQSPSHR